MALVSFKIGKIAEECEGIRTFELEGEAPPYKPGNFFRLWLAGEGGKKMFRPYSAASHPSEGVLRFCIKKNGVFTDMLWKLKQGDEVEVDGPFGTFLLGTGENERVFLAGGVGISAMRAMLIDTLLDGRRCSLFHSAGELSKIPYAGEMKLLAAQNPLFSYFPAVTRQEMPDGWDGMKGRLTADAIKARLGTLSGKAFYLCGPPEMVEGMAKALLDAGVKKENVKKEEWG